MLWYKVRRFCALPTEDEDFSRPLRRFQSTHLAAPALCALPHNNVIADIDDIFSLLAIEPLYNKAGSLLSDRT